MLSFQNLFMHTNQPAVFVVVADVMEFFDKFTQSVKFLVCYEVKCELMTARLTLNAGEVKFDFRTICGQESELKLTTAEGARGILLFCLSFRLQLNESTSGFLQASIKKLSSHSSVQGPARHHLHVPDGSTRAEVRKATEAKIPRIP